MMRHTNKQRSWGAFWLLACGLGASCSPQLGPKDGADLPPNDLDRMKVGELAPDFTLQDVEGKAVTLSSFRGKQFVVLSFYRGHW